MPSVDPTSLSIPTNLTEIDLAHNNLNSISKYVIMYSNEMILIQEEAFKGLTNLTDPFIIFLLDDSWMQDTAYWCPFSLSKQSPVFFWCSGLTLLPRCEQCCLAKHWLFVQLTILICNLLHLNDLKVFSRIHQSVK